MKRCGKCGIDKPLDEFHRQSRKPDGRQSMCKACAKIRNAAYYRSTPEKNEARSASRTRQKLAARAFVDEVLAIHPCVDCGEADPVVLEFDHVRGVKKFSISNAVKQGLSPVTIADEILKCEVRCANCHRRVTASRGGWHHTRTRAA